MIHTVSITGVAPDPEVYGGLAAATAYIGGSFGAAAKTWRNDLDADDQARTMVDATRWLDALGLVDGATPIGHDTELAAVLEACFEMAMLIGADPTVLDAVDAGSNVKTLDADGAKVEFFRGTSAAAGTAPIMPVRVLKRLAPYLPGAGSSATIGGKSFGTCGQSSFDANDAADRTEPF